MACPRMASTCRSTSLLGEASGTALATASTASWASMPMAMAATMAMAGALPRPASQWIRRRSFPWPSPWMRPWRARVASMAWTWAAMGRAMGRDGVRPMGRPACSRSWKTRFAHGPAKGRSMGRDGLVMDTTTSGRHDTMAACRASREHRARWGMARMGRRAPATDNPRGQPLQRTPHNPRIEQRGWGK